MKKVSQLLMAAAIATTPAFVTAADHTGGQQHGHEQNERGERGHRGEKMQKRMNRMLNKVDATDAQRSSIAALIEANKPNRKAHKEQHKALRKALAQLNPAAVDYQQQVNILADRGAELSRDKLISKALIRQQIFNQLTSEQQAKWQEIKQHRAERRAEKRGNM